MSFGFSVGDIIKVIELAKEVVQACRNGPREYREIRAEAKAIQTTLQRVHDDAMDKDSLLNRKGAMRTDDLLGIIESASTTINSLSELIAKNSTLKDDPGKSKMKRVWHAHRVGIAELDTITGRLTYYVSCLTAFLQSLEGSAVARIERKVDQIYTMLIQEDTSAHKSVSTATSTSTTASVRSRLEEDEEGVWREVKSALAAHDLSASDLMAYKDEIMQYLREKLDKDLREEPLYRFSSPRRNHLASHDKLSQNQNYLTPMVTEPIYQDLRLASWKNIDPKDQYHLAPPLHLDSGFSEDLLGPVNLPEHQSPHSQPSDRNVNWGGVENIGTYGLQFG